MEASIIRQQPGDEPPQETLGASRQRLPLQIGKSVFEHRAMTGIMAAFELLNDVLDGKAKGLFFAEAGRGFRRQARLSGCGSFGRFVLLRLDRFAFPTPRHARIIRRDCGTIVQPQRRLAAIAMNSYPWFSAASEVHGCQHHSRLGKSLFQKPNYGEKNDDALKICGYTA
jgi:hypothetical protein